MAHFAIIYGGIGQAVAGIAIANSPPASLPASETWINVTNVVPQPGPRWIWNGGTSFSQPPSQTEGTPTYKKMSATAFWDRWTQAERVAYEVAKQHDPAASNGAKQDAAKLRIFQQDISDDGFVNPSKNKIRNQLLALEGTILAVGRTAIILDTPITAAEAA